MNFVTYYQLSIDINNAIGKIPKDIDLVVGVPRSGMLVASIVALTLNKPLADVDSFLNKRLYSSGITKNLTNNVKQFSDVKNVLVVEDSVGSGRSILNVKKKIAKANFSNIKFFYFAPYVENKTKDLVDLYCKIIDQPRMFEWNYFHHAELEHVCVDIDGVLCDDPTTEENDDGEKYVTFIKTVSPKLIPSRKIGYIVTSRLEKYRRETEQWLKDNGIQYESLIMLDLEDSKTRRELNIHGKFKAEEYKKIKNSHLFIESNNSQAEEINKYTGKAVFCTDTHYYYDENVIHKIIAKNTNRRSSLIYSLKDLLKKILPMKTYIFLKKCKLSFNKEKKNEN